MLEDCTPPYPDAYSLPGAREIRPTLKILLYNPDNGVTRNFMPHLWMFLLQSLTPTGHEVVLIDGNAQPMDEAGIARYVIEQKIDLVGIGAMTRMIAKAYRMADAVRAAGIPVVMVGPPSRSVKPMIPGPELWKTRPAAS